MSELELLEEFCEAIESMDLVGDFEAGEEGDGLYIRACRALGREPKLPEGFFDEASA